MNASEEPDKRIKMVCQVCGSTWDDINAWTPRCSLHGGPVCMRCCAACEYRKGDAGIKACMYVDPIRRHEEALKRISSREAEENARITDAWIKKRREDARRRAIIKAKGRKATNESR